MSALTTRKQALDEIFSKGGAGQTGQFKKWMQRHKSGDLSIEKQEEILKNNGYKMVQESLWQKK